MVGLVQVDAAPGILLSLPSPAEVRRQPGVEFVRFTMPFGTSLSGTGQSTSDRVAEILLSAADRASWLARSASLRRWLEPQVLVAPARATGRQLRDLQHEHWPDSGARDEAYTPSPA